MTLQSRLRWLAPGALMAGLLFFAVAGPAQAQENNNRCEGTVTDDQGAPLAGVEITFLQVDKNIYAQPVKTSKKGKYAHNTITPSDYEIRATLAGYKMVQIAALTTKGDGTKVTEDTYIIGGDQKGLHKVHVSPQSRSDATSKGKCVVDFLMASEDRYQEAYHKMAEQKGAKSGQPAAPSGSASEAPGSLAPGTPAAPAAGAPTPTDPLDKGKSLIANHDYAGAVPALKEAVAAKPEDAEAHRWLGGALLQVGNMAEAEPELKKALELDPTFTGANFDMGMLYVKKGRLMQAIPHFEKELEINPGAPSVLQNLAKLYVDTKQYDKAVGIFDQLIATTPDNMENYGLLADCYKQMGNAAKEQEVYQKMGAADTSGMAFYNLGNIMFNKDEKEKAADAYRKAIEQNPEHADAHFQLGMTLVGLGKFKEAVAELETFMKLKPTDRRAAEAKSLAADLRKMGG